MTGSGPPLVMLHALPFDRRLWDMQVSAFADKFTCITMDLRGWGESAKPREPFTLPDMGKDVMGVIADLGISRDAVIMGCSIGSKISLMLACDHPEIFKATILVGGQSGLQDHVKHRIEAYAAHFAAGTLKDYHIGHLRHGVTREWADSMIGQKFLQQFAENINLDVVCIAHVFNALAQHDLTSKLYNYNTPTLIVNGQFDSALEGGRRTAQLIHNSHHEIIPKTGHCCFVEQPKTFNMIVSAFLARHNFLPIHH